MTSKNHLRSFTLMELLIAVAIIGVAVGMALTEFDTTQQSTATQAAALVANQLDYVRELSVANNTNYTVTFDKVNDRFALTHTGTDTSLDILPQSYFWQEGETAAIQYYDLDRIPAQWYVALTGAGWYSDNTISETSVEFLPSGGTTVGDDLSICLAVGSADPNYITITVSSVTGLTEVGPISKSTLISAWQTIRLPIATIPSF